MGGWRKAPGGQGRAPRLRVSLTTAPAPPGLLSASPLFGSSFFFVQSCSNVAVPAPCILAVNQNGLSFLSTETHVSGLTWPCIPPPQETSLPPAGLWARPLPRPHLPGGAGVRVKGGETLNSQGGPRPPWLRGGAGLQRQELFVPVLEAGRPGLGSWLRARRQPPCRPHRPRLWGPCSRSPSWHEPWFQPGTSAKACSAVAFWELGGAFDVGTGVTIQSTTKRTAPPF